MPHNPITGLTDIGARKYDPTTGTFISVDPVLDTGNPQQWNPYAYSNNNPITYSDPSGLYCDGCDFQNHNMGKKGPQVGVNCPPCTSNPNQAQEDYEIATGQNTDPNKQPSLGGRRIPTFEDLKHRPGLMHYMVSGTYEEAISDWAQGICTRAVPEDQDFCSVASAYGLLEVDPAAKQMALLIGLGVVLAPMVAECLASALCLRIAGGAADAISPEGAAFASAAGASAGAGRLLDDLIDMGRAACSFTGDTKVLMADGTLKPIRDVEVGDMVRAADPVTNESSTRRVTAVFVHKDDLLDLVMDDGARISTTGDHRFWSINHSDWRRADQFGANDSLLSADSRPAGVAYVDVAAIRNEMAFNLTVDSIHTYFVAVGAVFALVHNRCGDEWTIGSRMRAAGQGDLGLPGQGRIRYVPPVGYNPASPLPRGPQHGYIDRFGNEWVMGPSRTEGHSFEWDVQLSRAGRAQLSWLSGDGNHVNVSPLGEVTHK